VNARRRAGLVIFVAPLIIGQHVVSLGDLHEALAAWIIRVDVRVMLFGQPSERPLDLVGTRVLIDAQDLVVVLPGVVLDTQRTSKQVWLVGSVRGYAVDLPVRDLGIQVDKYLIHSNPPSRYHRAAFFDAHRAARDYWSGSTGMNAGTCRPAHRDPATQRNARSARFQHARTEPEAAVTS
jgi:hypothetical protein